MKTKVLSLAVLFFIGTMMVFAESISKKVEVKGNCGMCEKRIEKAALSVDGVSGAEWDKKTKQLEVTFDDSKTDIEKVQKAVAKAGHDTGAYKASEEVYNKLPDCCKYERSEKE
jgi:copper chaperone CopZ